MFVDETGNPDFNSSQPFTLSGAVFEYKYAVPENNSTCPLLEKLHHFKRLCFSTTDIPLHLDHISRKVGHFATIPDAQRLRFYEELPGFLSGLDFKIISVTIDKHKLQHYYHPSKDPYTVAFTNLLQNYYSFIHLNNVGSARIVIESRDDTQNLIVQKAFFDVFSNGTTLLSLEVALKERIKGFIIARKNDPLFKSGLEIADLICNPLSRVRRGLVEANPSLINYGTKNRIFAAIKHKIHTVTDIEDIRNWGFQKIPITKKKRPWVDDPSPKDNFNLSSAITEVLLK